MSNFRFVSIYLLSQRDRRARHLTFHPGRNLLLGPNHTGKSTVLRSLYETLGATPEGRLSQWDAAAITAVEFTVDEIAYIAVHQSANRALFGPDGQLILATSVRSEWSATFARITGFNLIVADKRLEGITADPACFFLPFYVNQDASWQNSWSTFEGFGRYKAPWQSILQYFSGMRPPEYYEAKAHKDAEERRLKALQDERDLLQRTRDRIGRTLPLSGPKVIPEVFQLDVSQLVDEVTALNTKQEELRDRAVREEELLHSLHLQVRLATETLATYSDDAEYLSAPERSDLVCPTCSAEHSESFLDYFAYAEDARVLRALVLKLQADAAKVRRLHGNTRSEVSELSSRYHAISEILNRRRGELRFGDVLKSMSAEGAVQAFADEEDVLKKQVQEHLLQIDALLRRIKNLSDAKRSNSILSLFRDYYAAARKALRLPPVVTARMRIESRPNLSGSGGPRSVLAYYAAIWRVCMREGSSFFVPVVVDSPNQQGQDEVNLPAVIRFIAQDLPPGIQLIVGLESPTDYEFDKTIRLTELYRLLRSDEYDSVSDVIEPLQKQMFDSILRRDQTSLFGEL